MSREGSGEDSGVLTSREESGEDSGVLTSREGLGSTLEQGRTGEASSKREHGGCRAEHGGVRVEYTRTRGAWRRSYAEASGGQRR